MLKPNGPRWTRGVTRRTNNISINSATTAQSRVARFVIPRKLSYNGTVLLGLVRVGLVPGLFDKHAPQERRRDDHRWGFSNRIGSPKVKAPVI